MHPGPSRKCSGCKVTNWSDWRTFLDLEGGPTSPVFDLEDENTLGTRRVDQTRRAPRTPDQWRRFPKAVFRYALLTNLIGISTHEERKYPYRFARALREAFPQQLRALIV